MFFLNSSAETRWQVEKGGENKRPSLFKENYLHPIGLEKHVLFLLMLATVFCYPIRLLLARLIKLKQIIGGSISMHLKRSHAYVII